MTDFMFFLQLGWEHIISADALDHQLFVIALIVAYGLKNPGKILILITAFTIGHSITLALSVFDLVRIDSAWVEFLIPLTIFLTALDNVLMYRNKGTLMKMNYVLALIFGLIHGLGFANTARMMLAKEQSIAIPLLGFNIGLEVGQIVVVAVFMLISYVVLRFLKVPEKYWTIGISVLIALFSLKMVIERIPF